MILYEPRPPQSFVLPFGIRNPSCLKALLVIWFLALILRSEGAVPAPIARWTFDRDARDVVGALHGELLGSARVDRGRLILDGYGFLRTGILPCDLTEKTLVATVQVAPLTQRGGGVLAVQTLDGSVFDAITFAGRDPQKWMAGSEAFMRTANVMGVAPENQGVSAIHMAISYASDGTIRVYRNGRPYGAPSRPSAPTVQFIAGNSQVLMGLQHTKGGSHFLAGEIEEAALYDRVLSEMEVSELVRPSGPFEPTIARIWNDEILNAIRRDLPHPPAHARNLFSLSAAMYDAWTAYDPVALGYAYRRKHTAANVSEARREAISYAAYQILRERFSNAIGSAVTLNGIDARMSQLGYSIPHGSAPPDSPASVGMAVASSISTWFLSDGSRQEFEYRDDDYKPVNGFIDPQRAGVGGPLLDVNRWEPLRFTKVIPVGQNGVVINNREQEFLGAPWLEVRPFAMVRTHWRHPGFDPGPPPYFGTETHESFVSNVVAVIRAGSELSPADSVMIDISPGAWGNNPLGSNAGTGRPVNPITGQPYAPNIVPRGDFARVLAEYWADGPQSETPPGHWNVMANEVTERLGTNNLRIGGTSAVADPLEWDVKLYFSINSALHDAACAAWSLKRHYDGWRPLTAIRYLGSLGQCSDPTAPTYHPHGLPLVPGLIELVTERTSRLGGRHRYMPTNTIVIRSWSGYPNGGVLWISPTEWLPYQRSSFVTPAFPGYVSGHSTFSRAAAEVLAAMTGSEFFPGGIGSYSSYRLSFEEGPSVPVRLEWATYYDAADQAGISRIWGGIHPPADDFAGRRIGSACGIAAWNLAWKYFNGSLERTENLIPKHVPSADCP